MFPSSFGPPPAPPTIPANKIIDEYSMNVDMEKKTIEIYVFFKGEDESDNLIILLPFTRSVDIPQLIIKANEIISDSL